MTYIASISYSLLISFVTDIAQEMFIIAFFLPSMNIIILYPVSHDDLNYAI